MWLGALACLGISVFLAPIVSGGWCADAPAGGTSTCGSFQRSLVGIDTNLWIWLGAIAIVAVITLVTAHRANRSRPGGSSAS